MSRLTLSPEFRHSPACVCQCKSKSRRAWSSHCGQFLVQTAHDPATCLSLCPAFPPVFAALSQLPIVLCTRPRRQDIANANKFEACNVHAGMIWRTTADGPITSSLRPATSSAARPACRGPGGLASPDQDYHQEAPRLAHCSFRLLFSAACFTAAAPGIIQIAQIHPNQLTQNVLTVPLIL